MTTGPGSVNFKRYFLAAPALLAGLCGFFPVGVCAGQPGVVAAPFLSFDPSPRASAMGGAYTAVTQDAYSAWWNPAGLAAIEVPEAAATYSIAFVDVISQYAGFAYPLSYGSTLGLNLTRQSVEPFPSYDASANPAPKIDAADMAITASYARTLLKDEAERAVLSAGVSVKRVSTKLDTVSASALGFDLGAVYSLRPSKYWMRNTPAQELRVALAIRNLGTGMRFDTEAFPLPQSATLGLAWLSHPAGVHTLTLALDVTSSNYDKLSINAGAEYFMFQLFSLRGGFSTGQASGAGPRLGFGYRLSYMDLDYSLFPSGTLGTVHKVGMVIRLGVLRAKQPLSGATARVGKAKTLAPKEKIAALTAYANDYIELARKNIAAREYTLAADNLNRAFNLEPKLKMGEWGDKAGRLTTLNDRLQLKETPVREKTFQKHDEQSDVAYEAVAAYIEGNELKAFLLAHAALGANPRGDPLFEELLLSLGDLARLEVRRDEIMPKVALVKEKLKKAAKGFYIQQFDMAVKECGEVTMLDEANPLGWMRLGSAYYMMGDKAKARKAYEKAMQLNPGDKVTRQFMDTQGWK